MYEEGMQVAQTTSLASDENRWGTTLEHGLRHRASLRAQGREAQSREQGEPTMLIPRGEKGKPANRFPFLTYAIIAIALVHYTLVRSEMLAVLGDFQVALGELLEYAMSDERLKIDSRLADYLQIESEGTALEGRLEEFTGDDTEERQAEFSSVRRPGQRSLKQAKLDQMCDDALAILLEHPGYAKGYGASAHDGARLLTHLFTYFSLPVLLGSVLILSLVGGFIEAIWGRTFWLVCFFGGGFLNAILFAHTETSGQLLFGFSAGAMALLGAFTVRYALKWVYFSYVIGSAAMPGFVIVAFALASEVLLPKLDEAFGLPPFNHPATPYALHAAVFAFGVVLAILMQVFKLEAKINPFDESAESVEIDTIIKNALHAKKSGKLDYAYDLLLKETRKRPSSVELLLAFWDVAVAHQKTDQAVPRMLQLIRDRLRSKATDEALEYWKVIATAHPEVVAEPRLLAQLALLLGKENREIASFTLRRFFDNPGEDATPKLATRLCHLAREIDCVIPVEIAAIALAGNDPDPSDRAYLENLVAAARGVARSTPTVKPEEIIGSRALDVADLGAGAPRKPQHIEVLDETAIEAPARVEDLLSSFEDTDPSLASLPAESLSPESVSPAGFSAQDLAGLVTNVSLEDLPAASDLPDFDAPLPEEESPEERAPDLASAPSLQALEDAFEDGLFDDDLSQKSVASPSAASAAVLASAERTDPGAAEDFGAFDPSQISLDAVQADTSAVASSRAADALSVEDFDSSALDPEALLAEAASEQSTQKSVESGYALDAEAVDHSAFDPDALSASLPSPSDAPDFSTEPGLFDLDTTTDVAITSSPRPPAATPPPAPRPAPVLPPTPLAPSKPAAPAPTHSAAPAATPDASFDDVDLGGLFGEEALPQLRRLAVQEMVPLAIEASALLLRDAEGQKQRIVVSDVQAVTFAGVRGLSEKPIVLIDVILNWRAAKSEPLQVLRLRSDQFNAKTLRPSETSPLQALHKAMTDLVQSANATPLPSVEICKAAAPKVYASLAQYHEEVLNAR